MGRTLQLGILRFESGETSEQFVHLGGVLLGVNLTDEVNAAGPLAEISFVAHEALLVGMAKREVIYCLTHLALVAERFIHELTNRSALLAEGFGLGTKFRSSGGAVFETPSVIRPFLVTMSLAEGIAIALTLASVVVMLVSIMLSFCLWVISQTRNRSGSEGNPHSTGEVWGLRVNKSDQTRVFKPCLTSLHRGNSTLWAYSYCTLRELS